MNERRKAFPVGQVGVRRRLEHVELQVVSLAGVQGRDEVER